MSLDEMIFKSDTALTNAHRGACLLFQRALAQPFFQLGRIGKCFAKVVVVRLRMLDTGLFHRRIIDFDQGCVLRVVML